MHMLTQKLSVENYFQRKVNIHTVNTRNTYLLQTLRHSNKYGANMIRCKGVQIYNKIPYDLQKFNSVKGFSKKFKHYLLQNM